ncbi:MAG: dienelactone hydrolase family protein [Chloroflexota bacterium]
MSIKKSDLQLDVNGRKVNAHFALPENGGPGILVLHAWWGLKPFFKEFSDRLAEQGYTLLAPDLFDGKIAKTIDEAKKLAQGSDSQSVGDIVMAAKDHLLSLTKNRIGVLGFSFGAAWALVAAGYDPEKIAATVLFCGAYPDMDFSKVKSKVLGHFCEVDEWEPIEGVRQMEDGMKAANVDATLHFYPKVSHWFMEPDRPEYDSASAQLAWERTMEFLNSSLRA